jgi:hypothetical protein
MRKLAFLLVVLAAVALHARDKESVEALQARAAAAEGKKQVELLVKVAQYQLKVTDELYSAGKTQEAQSALKDVVDYGSRACQLASETGERMKKTEIAVRKIAHRLVEIRKAVTFDDRPPLGAAIDTLEKAHDDLLRRMFKIKK